MPVVNDEYGYIGQTNPPITVRVNMDRFKLRSAAWGIATAGGYGSIGDIRLHRNGKGNPEITGDWIDAPEYDDQKLMIDFFTTKGIEYWKMSSQNELITAGKRTYLLAETGRQYVVYAATGGSFSIESGRGDVQGIPLQSADRRGDEPGHGHRRRFAPVHLARRRRLGSASGGIAVTVFVGSARRTGHPFL